MPRKPNPQPKKPVAYAGKHQDKFNKLQSLIEDVGDWNVNYNALSKEWGIPDTTIYRWKDKILKERPPIDPMKMGDQCIDALQSAIRQCQLKVKAAPTEKDKRGYMNTLAKLTDQITILLEKYGKKDSVADKLEVKGDVSFGVNVIIPESVKDLLEEDS